MKKSNLGYHIYIFWLVHSSLTISLVAGQNQTLTGHSAGIFAVAFANNGLLVSGSLDWTVKVWDNSQNWALNQSIGSCDSVTGLTALSNDQLACACNK